MAANSIIIFLAEGIGNQSNNPASELSSLTGSLCCYKESLRLQLLTLVENDYTDCFEVK